MELTILVNRLEKITALCWGLTAAILFNAVITLEWTTAACNQQQDGPILAAFGFPLPYLQWSGVSSLEYTLMPSAYLFNMLLLGSIFFYSSYVLHKKLIRHHLRPSIALTSLALISAGMTLGLESLRAINIYTHTSPGLHQADQPYSAFRPVAIDVFEQQYHCTPSRFWFQQTNTNSD